MSEARDKEHTRPIPERLNVFIFLASACAGLGLLWGAAHVQHFPLLFACAFLFSLLNNTLFSLLHEAVHGILHPNHQVNDWLGRLAACFFPTSFTLQRAFHLAHHRHNRSKLEQFDYIHEGDNRFFKYAQWYCILTGLYWLFVPLGCLVYLLWPAFLGQQLNRLIGKPLADQTGASSIFERVGRIDPWVVRGEIVIALAFQALLFLVLDLNAWTYAFGYALFALQWSALQYADHAFSPLDPKKGAWNLCVPRWLRYVYLNYHDHLVHHQKPELPWLYLHDDVEPVPQQPNFWRIYLEMWKGPRPFPEDAHAR